MYSLFYKIENMRTFAYLIAGCFIAFTAFSCVQPPNYPNEPFITFRDFNKTAIAQGNLNAIPDTLVIRFDFEDGDGDLGFVKDSIDVFLTDSRKGFVNTFRLPFIPDEGAGNGISGTIILRIPNTPFNICCTYPDNSATCQPNPNFPTDTMSYSIQIRDRANNYSNKIQTDVLTILCN